MAKERTNRDLIRRLMKEGATDKDHNAVNDSQVELCAPVHVEAPRDVIELRELGHGHSALRNG
jgi:hypothetical protein